jgi:nitrite reductase/ring-hydroxylating ferredoxin subunit
MAAAQRGPVPSVPADRRTQARVPIRGRVRLYGVMKVVVGRVSDFANGDRKIIDVNGKSIGVFRVDDQFYAIRNRCPHQFGPLCLGALAQRAVADAPGDVRMEDGPPLIACPWHGWEYDLATGQSFMGPGRGNMAALSYDVTVLPGSELAGEGPAREGRVPGPYIAETMPVSVERDYVVVEDSPARRDNRKKEALHDDDRP